jgi:predicted small integral membrane protein
MWNRPAGEVGGLARFGTLSVANTVFAAIGALYMSLVALGNVTAYEVNWPYIQHVLAMDTTFRAPHLMWRAIESEAVQTIAYVGIIAWETLCAAVLIWATGHWLAAHRRNSFDVARRWSTLGFLMMILLFGGGFIVIGGEWFAMWQSSRWNGLQAALQNFTIAAFGLLLVHLPSTPSPTSGAT